MKLLHDLRRRRIFRLAGLYIVGAWIVIEVASVFFPAWGIPDTAMRYLFVAAALCFPIALIFGWTFDITSDGIVRTKGAGPGESVDLSLKRPDYVVLVALLAVGVAIVLGSAEKIYEEIDTSPTTATVVERLENSVAVLPFINLDPNPDTGFFSDGVTEEILHRLSSLRVLHVLGRTSSFAFRNSDDGPARISEILGVRYLLQGSVRRDEDYVRVTARLTDESGFDVWSQTFDRKLESIFVIQSEIASTVSNQIVNEIVPLSAQAAGRTTTNMDAYNDYLVGKAYFNARTPNWQENATQAYRRAISLDPGFAPPYAGLAIAGYIISATSKTDETRQEMWEAVRTALTLDPELAEAHAAHGLLLGDEETDDLEASVVALRRAIEIDPTHAFAYAWLSSALSELGQEEESQAAQLKGLAIDPLNPVLSVNSASRLASRGDYQRAEKVLLRLTDLPEPPGLVYAGLVSLYTDTGRLDEALYWSKQAFNAYHEAASRPIGQLIFTYERLGMREASDYWRNRIEEFLRNPFEHFAYTVYQQKHRGEYAEMRALLQSFSENMKVDFRTLSNSAVRRMGATNTAAGNFDVGIDMLEHAFSMDSAGDIGVDNYAYTLQMKNYLAYAYRQVGNVAASEQLLLSLRNHMESEAANGDLNSSLSYENLALARAMLGDLDGAANALRKAVEIGWMNYYWVMNDPVWAEFIQMSEIQPILDDVKIRLDQQRASVEADEATHDFKAEVEQLLQLANPTN